MIYNKKNKEIEKNKKVIRKTNFLVLKLLIVMGLSTILQLMQTAEYWFHKFFIMLKMSLSFLMTNGNAFVKLSFKSVLIFLMQFKVYDNRINCWINFFGLSDKFDFLMNTYSQSNYIYKKFVNYSNLKTR